MSEPTARSRFSEFLAHHDAGHTDREAGAALRTVLEAAQISGKSGAITLKLTVSPQGDSFKIAAQVDHKVPRNVADRTYWVGLDGWPSRNPATQPSMFEEKDTQL